MNTILKDEYYKLTIDDSLIALETKKNGLTAIEASNRLMKYGKNELAPKKLDKWYKVFFKQVIGVMNLILIAAAILAIFFGALEITNVIPGKEEAWVEFIDGGFIFLIIFINSLIGTIQEIKANQAIDALNKISAPSAKVHRDGVLQIIPTSEIVPGDIVFIDDGSIVPCDLRLIASSNLQVQEASLTGESVPVDKDANEIIKEDSVLADRINLCYSSTIVTYGNAVGICIGTGLNTEIGKIAQMLDDQKTEKTHIEQKMDYIAKKLTLMGIMAAIIVLFFNYIGIYVTHNADGTWVAPIMLAITLAVAVIPEGLPSTATIVMALGVKKMATKNAIVKTLSSVETLGSVSCICSDKTGTLTLNQMTVTTLLNYDDISNPKSIPINNVETDESEKYIEMIEAGIVCNTASLDEKNKSKTIGDPTEGALLVLGEQYDIGYKTFRDIHPKLFEQPFDSIRKSMSVVVEYGAEKMLYVKGAGEELLNKCTKIIVNNKVVLLTEQHKTNIRNAINKCSENALRVLGFAKRLVVENHNVGSDLEHDLIFMGLVGMIDPPRKEVKAAVATCHEAGMRVIMITGDHAITAKRIATDLGIYNESLGDLIINGTELDIMNDDELKNKVMYTTVFSRISPNGKLRIINALKSNNQITSMTGDGVNDAPSLKAANIGVAMGITGTDVAKQSANLILLDDNFTTIEGAIFEGRRIYRNIQKVVQFLLAGSVSEILILIFATIIGTFATGYKEVLNPIQILCINLLTDTIPCIALGIDHAEDDVMKREPKDFKHLLTKDLVFRILGYGLFFSMVGLCGYIIGNQCFDQHGMTMAFLVMAISQSLHAFNQQSNTISIFTKKNKQNKWLYISVGISLLIIIALIFTGVYGGDKVQHLLGISKFTGIELVIIISLSVFIIPLGEIAKCFERKLTKRNKTNISLHI
ncbi:MAG: cation-translocating P-type ATPase [Mycoplasmoidaceae bacterium]|nr:MAG: cation-translocating P-type ATPase [Mycoplasmoidaceae bacterium]